MIHSRAVQYHSDGTGRDTYIGFNKGGLAIYGHKQVKQIDQFKQSLRQIDRPQSTYSKSGGFSVGMRRTASVTLLAPRAGDSSRREDIFKSSQLHFSKGFAEQ